MRRIAMLLVTALALGALAVPALAEESAPGGAKIDPALEEELTYGTPLKNKALTDEERQKALADVGAESSPMPAIIAFGMFGVVIMTIGAGAVAYRKV